MKKTAWLLVLGLFWAPMVARAQVVADEVVIKMVDMAAADIAKDAPGTFAKINKSEVPYKDATNPELYVFVYDQDVNMIAHIKADLVGKNFKGKPDVKGKKFRDEIVTQAMSQGSVWVDYMYQKPGDTGLFEKTTYAKSIQGSDGKVYIVCVGKYKK